MLNLIVPRHHASLSKSYNVHSGKLATVAVKFSLALPSGNRAGGSLSGYVAFGLAGAIVLTGYAIAWRADTKSRSRRLRVSFDHVLCKPSL